MYYVYILKCANKDLYIGFSTDLRRRIEQHKSGTVKSTKAYLPVKLVYYESYLNKTDALKRELQLKNHKPKIDLKDQIINSIDQSGEA